MDAFPQTIPELLERRAAAAAAVAPAPWLLFENESWSLADVVAEVDRTAVGLAERGVVKGDRVAILLGNRPESIFTWFAANRLGAIAAPLNPAYKRPELVGMLRLLRPRVLCVADGDLRLLADSALVGLEGDVPTLASPFDLARAGHGAPRPTILPDDVAVLLATSGTTGAPKAVMQTHRTYALTAESFPSWLGLTERDRLLISLPLFHINAQAYSVMGALGVAAGVALLPRFSASRFWAESKRVGATQVNVVGAMVNILLNADPGAEDRDHALRSCYAALALPEAQHRAFEDRFGLTMSVGYGLTETTFGTVWPRDAAARYGSMGRLRQHPRLGVINRARVAKEDDTDAVDGEVGELWLDNPAMLRGYWTGPGQISPALTEGWFRTGDLVSRDGDGFFTFVARKKEVIRRRGENVAASEVEAALTSHPSVDEAAVIGCPSSLGEEELVAYVSPRLGSVIDVEQLRAWVRERLADFKVPSQIHVRDSLPHTATERIAKHLLK